MTISAQSHRVAALAAVTLGSLLGCSSADDPADTGGPGSGGPGSGAATTGASGGSTDATTSSTGSGMLPPVDESCKLPDAAFCDAFTKPSPGGRAGSLDDARWSFARLGFGCSNTFAFPATALNVCGTWKTVEPGGPDSDFCVDENNDPHWVEGFNDNGTFQYMSARVRQPFDFAGRTSTLQWEADARTSGGHGWWVETWITEEPVPGPNFHPEDQLTTSKRAIGIVMDLNCGVPAAGLGTAGAGKVGVSKILIVDDYGQTDFYDPFAPGNDNSRCVTTEQGKLNTFQFKISESRVEVWATGVNGEEIERIAEADVTTGFSRGYVNISHVHYNAHKAEVTNFQAYQWARVAFDGPQLPTPRAYEIPDPLTKTGPTSADCEDVYRIGYAVTDSVVYDFGASPSSPLTLKFTDVDPSGATGARLNFSTSGVAAGDTLRYRFNGGAWRDWVVPGIHDSWERQGFSVPIDASDLVAGDNTIEFGTNSAALNMPPNSMHIANIDLEVEVP